MQSIPFHIAYLLTRYECVIVPGLGAFVVSSSDIEKANQEGILLPPENFLGFNPEIKHNDGLLANSIIKEKKISYKEANLLITRFVINISHSLDAGKRVRIPGVGTLFSKDNKNLFHPDKILSCNSSNYGLVDFSLPCLKDLRRQTNIFTEKKNKEIVWIPISRKFIFYAGSVAAAFIAMCIIPTPLNNGLLSPTHTQYASFISLSKKNTVNKDTNVNVSKPEEFQTPADSFPMHPETNTLPSEIINNPETTNIPDILNDSEGITEQEVINNPAEAKTFHYYIIIASCPDQPSAKQSLAEFRSKGFKNASILFSDGRYRIYTNRFENKVEGEKFLIQFRKNYPEYSYSWLLKRKN